MTSRTGPKHRGDIDFKHQRVGDEVQDRRELQVIREVDRKWVTRQENKTGSKDKRTEK